MAALVTPSACSISTWATASSACKLWLSGLWLLVSSSKDNTSLKSVSDIGFLLGLVWIIGCRRDRCRLALRVSHFAQGYRCEIQVSFNGKAQRAAGILKIAEGNVTPFFNRPDDISEEDEVTVLFGPFGDVPGPVGVGREELDIDGRVFVSFLRVKRRQDSPQLFGEQFHRFLLH